MYKQCHHPFAAKHGKISKNIVLPYASRIMNLHSFDAENFASVIGRLSADRP